jgi:hypothetical protein
MRIIEYVSESVGHGTGADSVLPRLIRTLADFDPGADDAVRVDAIRQLEELKSAAASVQARITAEFATSQREANVIAGMPAERAERGIASQVALAKRTSPFHARRYLGWAKILTTELPKTFAALQAGVTTEWRAMIVARETAWLSREDRATVDREMASRLEHLGDKKTESEAKKVAYRLDPGGYVDRLRNAVKDRRVSLRPAPDTMARITALLPVADGVASYATLGRDADTLVAAGDSRSRGQIMADLLVERLTGQTTADGTPVEVQVVIGADTLLDTENTENTATDAGESGTCGHQPSGAGAEPAHVSGYGPVPASWARELALAGSAPHWLRRLFTRPDTGELMSMETTRRLFTDAQRRFVLARDQVCRTPYCEAPIRHVDHVVPVEAGGPTRVGNAQGLCAACNFAKQAPGWRARPGPGGRITITTPTGHRYHSRSPDLMHTSASALEVDAGALLHAAA